MAEDIEQRKEEANTDNEGENTDDEGSNVEDGGRPCYCPLGGIMDLLSRKYAIQIICVVGVLQPVRYGEIEDAFGSVSSTTLSARLDELSEAGLLERRQYDEIPPRVEYRLTDEGEALGERLEPLVEWIESRE